MDIMQSGRVRVSTADQHVESQLYDLRELATKRGLEVVKEYQDCGVSGRRARRPGLDGDQARPYNFAISPVVVNLSGSPVTLLGPFEKDPERWGEMSFINIHDGSTHKLNGGSLLVLPQTFEMVFAQYSSHPEYESLAPQGTPCKAESQGLLSRYPVTATAFHLIGKESERGWEQSEDISTLLPSLIEYGWNVGRAQIDFRERLRKMSLDQLQKASGLSRHTILRARRGERIHPRSFHRLRTLTHN